MSAFAQEPGVDEPIRYADDAKQIFIQDFEGSADWQTIRLNPDPKRPTTLYTWQAQPVDSIKQVTYYKRNFDGKSSDNPSATNIYNGEQQWEIAGVRDTVIYMYDGVMRTDAAWPDDSTLQWDKHSILQHDDDTQHGTAIGGKEFGLDRYGEDGGTQYFRYVSATSKGTANRGGGSGGWAPSHDEASTTQDHYVPEYRRNLFVRNLPIQDNSSYRVTVFIKPTLQASLQKGVKARIGLDLMRGYFHSEKPFMVDMGVKGSDGNMSYRSFADKTDFTDLEVGKWNKITLMSYYNNDSVGNASAYLLSYYWNNDWDWVTKVDKDGNVVADGDSATLKFIQQPAKYFVRLSFRSDSTMFDVDNLSLTKSWIGGVEYSNDMIRVDFGYKTNLGELAQAAKEMNKIAAVQLPGTYFDVWALWTDEDSGEQFWENVPILSAEYQGDGYMYMWTEPTDEGDVRSFEGADSVLVSFYNSVAADSLKLKYTGDQYPNGLDTVWIANGKPVFDFHNEIASLNPTIGISPVTKQPVKSLAELCPVLQKEPYEDGTFGLDPKTRSFRFKFSKNLSFDNAGALTAKTKVTLKGNGVTEYWDIQDYPADDISGWTTIVRPAEYTADLQGDYVLAFDQVTHLKNPDLNLSDNYGDPVKLNYHFGDFSENPEIITYFQTDWNVPANVTEAVCLGTAIIDGTSTSYTLGTGAKGSGSRLYRYSDAGQMDCAYYLCPRGTSVDAHLFIGVGDAEYKINLKAGSYKISFFALGWDGKSATNLYVYAEPTEDGEVITPDKVKTEDKTLIGSFTPTNHIGNSDGKKTSYVITTADAMSYTFNVPADGNYIIEFEMPKAANWNGTLYSDIAITNTGALSDGPVNRINSAIASAAKMLAAAEASKYRGANYDNLVAVKAIADGFIAAKKATKVNLPSDYEAEGKDIDAAVSALKLHMDTVDAFDKSFAAVEAKLAVYADSLKAFEELAVVTALKGVKATMSDYAYSSKAPGVIAADTKTMDDAVKAVEDRQALNDAFNKSVAESDELLKNEKASKYAAENQALIEAVADAKQFDAIGATDDELKAQTASLDEVKLALDVKIQAAEIVSIRIKALDKLAKSLEANYGEAATEIAGRVAAIDFDDDGLADVMKAAIKAALYDKIAKGDSTDVDLTPFIKNYHLYATPKYVERTTIAANSNEAKVADENGANIQHVKHQWNSGDLDGKQPIWIMILENDYETLYPGWTARATATGNCMVTPDDDTYGKLKQYVPVFDGQLAMDWNGKAEIKNTVQDLPVGLYNLGVTLKQNTGNGTVLNAASGDKTYESKVGSGAKSVSIDSIAVSNGTLDIDFILTSGSGWSQADNFTLKYSVDSREIVDFAALAAQATQEMNELITVVDEYVAAGAQVEFFSLGGIKVDVLQKGQTYIEKITIGDQIETKTVYVE